MAVIEGTPPNAAQLGMSAEERALEGRPRAALYFQHGFELMAKNLGALIRNSPTPDGMRPVTVLLDIARWDGAELENVTTVFIQRGFREAELTRAYVRYLRGVDIYYVNDIGEVLEDVRPADISSAANPLASLPRARANPAPEGREAPAVVVGDDAGPGPESGVDGDAAANSGAAAQEDGTAVRDDSNGQDSGPPVPRRRRTARASKAE